MYDGGKIIVGLIIFAGLMTFPIWYNHGDAGAIPNVEKPKDVKECVKDTQYMRTTHMVLLNEWRDNVLREGNREKLKVGNKTYDRSLMNGCMVCHTSKEKFCDQCHLYASVKPYCWDCHFLPKETL
ncbi:MAG: sulfate reduction electron transfer complex DsrMKJOP subunit DsrJ [Proteobacteria bacterium]|nr:sulfate reduction electron transfer complex DsrMKJOP subunit DsrJ [Pseudomonadota bacterium]MBU1710916.1 sulfate reduction electron transfer complex DsrMKJOP subunit DsrJ [Pseudomonadota bacterium]